MKSSSSPTTSSPWMFLFKPSSSSSALWVERLHWWSACLLLAWGAGTVATILLAASWAQSVSLQHAEAGDNWVEVPSCWPLRGLRGVNLISKPTLKENLLSSWPPTTTTTTTTTTTATTAATFFTPSPVEPKNIPDWNVPVNLKRSTKQLFLDRHTTESSASGRPFNDNGEEFKQGLIGDAEDDRRRKEPRQLPLPVSPSEKWSHGRALLDHDIPEYNNSNHNTSSSSTTIVSGINTTTTTTTAEAQSLVSPWPAEQTPTNQNSSGVPSATIPANSETLAVTVLPVILVCIASTVVVCAVMLYISDLRDRCQHRAKQILNASGNMVVAPDNRSRKPKFAGGRGGRNQLKPQRSGSTGEASHESGTPWVVPPPILPPLPHQLNDLGKLNEENNHVLDLALFHTDRICLSRVSSMTNSWGEVGCPVEATDLIPPGHDHFDTTTDRHLEQVMEMSGESDRFVASDVLTTPMAGEKLTLALDGYDRDPHGGGNSSVESQLYGENVLEEQSAVTPTTKRNPTLTGKGNLIEETGEEGGQGRAVDFQQTIERLMAQIPERVPSPRETLEPVQVHDYVRDIFFVALTEDRPTIDSLGFRLDDATCSVTHPGVMAVRDDSPLVGRLFPGDIVLRINDIDAAGLTQMQAMNWLMMKTMTGRQYSAEANAKEHGDWETQDRYSMIKLTVMSARSDGGSDESVGPYSVEYDENGLHLAVEV